MTRTRPVRAHVAAALALALAGAATVPLAGAPGQGTSAADAVSAEVRRYFEAVKRNDAAALETLLAQDYVEVSPLGQVDKRAQVLRFYRTAANARTGQASELAGVTIDDLSVRVYGDLAVAIVRESFNLNVSGQPVPRPMCSTLVWHRVSGAWKLVSSHHTMIRPPLGPETSVGR
jgi:ketosteroid isomerase-like protein